MEARETKALRESVRGAVVAPGDDAYDETRATFNGLVDRRPAVIVQPEDANGVVRAVAFAAECGLGVSVRGGGHSVAGHSMGDGAVAIDLRRMRAVRVDPAARRVVAEGGATWEELDPACVEHGLVTTGGTFGDTGIGGLSLGGGIGHLQGTLGLTVDNIVSARVVTASGRVVVASAEENPDLFWALRGGGGNFGVAIELEYALHPLGELFGGLIVYPGEQASAALRAFRELALEAPDELTTQAIVGHPDALGGVAAAVVSVCLQGPAAEGEKLVEPLRRIPAMGDGFAPIGYIAMQAIYGKMEFGLRNYWKGHFVRELPDEALERTIDAFASAPRRAGILIEEFHGAPSRVPNDAMAFNQRESRFNASALAIWEKPEEDEDCIRWARDFASALEPYSTTGGYVNYMASDEPAARVRAAYGPEKFDRLRAIKRAWDPDNLFRFNQNIPPA